MRVWDLGGRGRIGLRVGFMTRPVAVSVYLDL